MRGPPGSPSVFQGVQEVKTIFIIIFMMLSAFLTLSETQRIYLKRHVCRSRYKTPRFSKMENNATFLTKCCFLK